MIITSIEKYKGDTFCVIADGNKRVYLHRDIIVKFRLKADMEISNEDFAKVLMMSELRRATRRAMYLINEREYSFIGLFEKLQKNYTDDICYKVLEYMVAKGYVNDKRYAEAIVYNYMECKLFGPRRVKEELYKRGIRGKVAEMAIEEHSEGSYQRLMKLIEKKYVRDLYDPDDIKAVTRVKNGLVRAGYGYDEINQAVKEFLEG